MFDANRQPENDRQAIERLIAQLGRIKAERFVLISTIAVLDGFSASDEDTASFEGSLPYGVHRRLLEEFVAANFPDALVVRLPALFGAGLKKNFLFDLLNPMPSMLSDARLKAFRDELGDKLGGIVTGLYRHDPVLDLRVVDRSALAASAYRRELEAKAVELGFSAEQFTNRESQFQYYDLGSLWTDIQLCLDAGLRVIHLAPAPLRASDIFERIIGETMPETPARLHREDMRTSHFGLWGKAGPYIADEGDVLHELDRFFLAERPSG